MQVYLGGGGEGEIGGHFNTTNLPVCQTPSQKRTYTMAHSLNLHLPDLHPESTEIWQQGKKNKEKERQKEMVQNTKTMRLNDDVT